MAAHKARLDEATLHTIHDLEGEIEHLNTQVISLEASLAATAGELRREQEANEKLARERDYYRAFGIGIATRLHVISEGIEAIQRGAELAGYEPPAIASFRDATAEQVDTALTEMGKRLGANGAEHEEPKVG